MRRFVLYALIAVGGLAAMGQDSCGTTTKDQPDSSGDQQSSKPQKARLGDTITLKGFEDKTKLRVTIVKLIDPLKAGQYDEPEKGNRFVGVVLRMKNVGQGTYDDSPSNGAKLILADNTQAKTTIVSGGECGNDFASDATISPGSVQVGCIPFEAKEGWSAKLFQFGLESGFGPQSGEWRLK